MKRHFSIMIIFVLAIAASANLEAKKKYTQPSDRAVYHNNMGVKYLGVENIPLAELEFKTALELSPDYVEAYNNMGIVSKKKGDLRSAKLYFEKALELDKKYSSAYSHLSMVYMDEGNLDKALTLGKLAVKKGSVMPITHYNLALVYLEKDKQSPSKSYQRFAEKELKTATELNANMFEAHLTLARLYKSQGKYELSAIRYRLALNDHPQDIKAWTELGEVYKAMGDEHKAENAFKQAMSMSGQGDVVSNPQMEYGIELLNRQQYTAAIKELTAATKVDPKNELTFYRLGGAYLQLGEIKTREGSAAEATQYFKDAIPPLEEALKLNPQMADAAYNIGLARYRLGEKELAKTAWNKALSIDINNQRALYNMGIVSKEEGNTREAISYFCRFAKVAGPAYPAERDNALNLIESSGGKCQN